MYMHVNRATSTNLYTCMTEGGSPDEANYDIDADPRPAPQQFLCSGGICHAPKMFTFSKTMSL